LGETHLAKGLAEAGLIDGAEFGPPNGLVDGFAPAPPTNLVGKAYVEQSLQTFGQG
jgi:hypothetical protein